MTPPYTEAEKRLALDIARQLFQYDPLLGAAESAALLAIRKTSELAAEKALTFRPRGDNAKHFVDVLVCDIAAALRSQEHLERRG